MRKRMKSFVSKTSDEAIDLVVNLTGKYIDKEKRRKLKRDAEIEIGTKIEEAIAETYQIALEIAEECQQKKPNTDSFKEKFYSLTDTYFKSFMPGIPKNTHVMDHLFQVCKELKDSRFDWAYLKDTKYSKRLEGMEKLANELQEAGKIGKSWEVLNEFKDSKDFYLLLQATLQRILKHYEFLAQDFSEIRKKQVDKYLEIYDELSGVYEKFIALLFALIQLSRTEAIYRYESARKRSLSSNIFFIKENGWEILVSGFNRNIRNAIAHKTCNVDILQETVEFIDRDTTVVLTFKEAQKETRELGALLLILPHIFILIFCLQILSVKEILENLPK